MFGFPCKSYSDCASSSYESYSRELTCQNGRCNCSRDSLVELQYNSAEGRYECDSAVFVMFGGIKCTLSDEDSCPANGYCLKSKEKWNRFRDKYECVCNDGYIMISRQCREIEHVRVGEACGTPKTGTVKFCDINSNKTCQKRNCQCIRDYYYDDEIDACITRDNYVAKFRANLTVGMYEFCGTPSKGLPSFCDEAANMTCMNTKCQCKLDFYLKADSEFSDAVSASTCETKESFVSENNLTSYKVMPGMYCHSNSDCIDGLTCFETKCSCPHPCVYVARTSACDCGVVSATEGASQAIVVGILGGALIIAGWLYLIRKQLRKAKGADYMTASADGDDNCNNSNPAGNEMLPSSSQQASSSTAVYPEKHRPSPSVSPSTPHNALPSYISAPTTIHTSQPPPPYSPHFPANANLEPTAPPTGFASPPVPYPVVPSYPAPPAAPTAAPLPYPIASSHPGTSFHGASAGIASDVPGDLPPPYTETAPPYTETPQKIDIYQPIV